ncbi:MAG: PD40 domain-containing protein [Lewinellaceae bacterium]|nr:PD40 domain-containing protein [Lewinellaceae bacterium]
MTKTSLSYRYPGLQPFEAKDAALFYGRERESRALYAQVMVEKMVVLFAKSGMGKSSLLNAGLTPLLEKTNVLPLNMRLNKVAMPLEEQFLEELDRDEFQNSVMLDPALRHSGAPLWEQIKAAQFIKNGAPAVPLFILDQFEEIFTLYTPELRQKFVNELAELTNGNPPESYLERLRSRITAGERLDVPTLESSPRCKFIFAIRSDLLHLLNGLTPFIPDIMRGRFELLPFGRVQAEEAITMPAMFSEVGRSFASPPFQYNEAALDTLINYLSKNGAEDVESFQLQILCQYVERLMIGENTPAAGEGSARKEIRKSAIVTPALFGNEEGLKAILRNFYTDQIAALPAEKQMIAREIIEEELITETERRRSVAEDDLLHLHADRPLLDQLVEMRLLRKEPRLKTFYYEISHDTLVPPILVKYKERHQEEERLAEQERLRQEKAERDAQLARERQKRIRALRITLYSLTLAVVSIVAMIYAIMLRNAAERDKRLAYANDIAYKSQIALREGDRTAAFRLAEFAHLYVDGNNNNVLGALAEAYYYNDHPDSLNHRLPWNFNPEGHNAPVWVVAFSPDGKQLATASEDNTAKIWDLNTGKNVLTLERHKASVEGIAFSPDGKWLATASEDSSAVIWDLQTGKPRNILRGHENSVSCIAFSPDGKKLATGSHDNFIMIWNAETGDSLRRIEAHEYPILSIAFSPDGKSLATGSYDETAKIWDIDSGKAVFTLEDHDNSVNCVAFSPDGNYLATGSNDKTAKIWDLKTGKATQTIEGHSSNISSVAFSPDGKSFATGSYDNSAKIWDLTDDGRLFFDLEGHRGYVSSVAFSPDGNYLATGSVDNNAKIWDLHSEREAVTLTGPKKPVRSVAFSPDGKKLAAASDDNTAKIWELGSSKTTLVLEGHTLPVLCVAFSPDGKKLATASEDSTARIWEPGTGKMTLLLRGHEDYVGCVAFSPNGKVIATGSDDKTIKIWNPDTGKPVSTLAGHDAAVNQVAISPDGKWLASASEDSTARIWNLETGKEKMTLRGHNGPVTCIAFSPDGKRFATGSSDKTAKIWDTTNGDLAFSLKEHLSAVSSLAFSPDGKKLATGSDDKTAKVWDLTAVEVIMTLEGHSKSVKGIAFSPDGKQVATGAFEGIVKIWDIDADVIIQKLKSQRRLAPLTHPQLNLWGLKGLLDMRKGNEDRLRQTGETWQIAAFADLYAQDSRNSRDRKGFDRASRLYRSAAESGGDSTLLLRLRSFKSQ